MKTFLALFWYAAIGGLLYGLAFNGYKERCPNARMDMSELFYTSVSWPAVLMVSLVVDKVETDPCPIEKEGAR